MNKVCKDCGKVKELEAFAKNAGMRDGRLNVCKVCTNAKRPLKMSRTLEQRKQYRLAYRQRHPHKYRAQRAVRRAIKRGDMTKQPCETCGLQLAHAHHDDYTKPLAVRWLCHKHHMQVHYG